MFLVPESWKFPFFTIPRFPDFELYYILINVQFICCPMFYQYKNVCIRFPFQVRRIFFIQRTLIYIMLLFFKPPPFKKNLSLFRRYSPKGYGWSRFIDKSVKKLLKHARRCPALNNLTHANNLNIFSETTRGRNGKAIAKPSRVKSRSIEIDSHPRSVPTGGEAKLFKEEYLQSSA